MLEHAPETQSRFERLLSLQSSTADACFLCGDPLTTKTRTREHVIPAWLQARFNLHAKRMDLLNGTSIPYSQLVTPCCAACNNDALRPLENKVCDATARGAGAVRDLDKPTLFLWLAKIFYGLLHRELFLANDRSDPTSKTITSPELLKEFRFLFALLQATRTPMDLDPVPASLMVYEVQVPADPSARWDFRDSLHRMFMCLRMGAVGIVAVLEDGGAQQPIMDTHLPKLPQPLHPFQHLELCAKVCYASTLANRVPQFLTVEHPRGINLVQMPLAGLSGIPIFDEWNDDHYADVLAAFTRQPRERVLHPEDGAYTWLSERDGSPKHISLAEMPWPPG